MTRIAVTGGSGKADLTDFGQTLEAELSGAEALIIAAADTVLRRPSRELMNEVFPGVPVPVRDGLAEHGTLLGIDKARRLLGYRPEFTWRSLF